MVSIAEAMEYVGIDPEYATDAQKAHVERCLDAAYEWIAGAVGREVDVAGDARVDALVERAVCELFEERTLTDTRTTKSKLYSVIGRMTNDLLQQLRWGGDEPWQ